MNYDAPITIVSGLPRAGTSLVMQLLAAGGLPVLTDDFRPADTDNPNGYFEYTPVKRLKENQAWLAAAQGNAVKIVSPLLEYLPDTDSYKVLFVQRPLDAIIASQNAMLSHRNEIPEATNDAMRQAYEKHLAHIQSWLAQQAHMDTLYLSYPDLLQDPEPQLKRMAEYLHRDLDLPSMSAVIDQDLNHH